MCQHHQPLFLGPPLHQLRATPLEGRGEKLGGTRVPLRKGPRQVARTWAQVGEAPLRADVHATRPPLEQDPAHMDGAAQDELELYVAALDEALVVAGPAPQQRIRAQEAVPILREVRKVTLANRPAAPTSSSTSSASSQRGEAT